MLKNYFAIIVINIKYIKTFKYKIKNFNFLKIIFNLDHFFYNAFFID
jgi:hypothetical protein